MILFKQKMLPINWEYIFLFIANVTLLISCVVVSYKKFFWNDELLSYYLLSDPSFTHMMVAWGDKFNNAPPLYFILGWLWAKVFTSTDLSLRLFSSLGICLACITVWITLRRTYDFWSTSLGTFSVFCFSELILYHNAEVRMYGLFAGVCALGLFQFDTINRRQRCSWKVLVVNTLIHAAIVLTHLYGIFYSGAILIAFLIRDRYFQIWRLKVYLSIILGWLFLIPCLAPIINQADIAKHRIWFRSIGFRELLNYLNFSINFSSLILVLLLVSMLFYINDNNNKQVFAKYHEGSRNLVTEVSLLILAGTFFAVPVLGWMITRTIRPMLVDRYIIPTIAISWPILLVYLSSQIFSKLTFREGNAKELTLNDLFVNKQKLILILIISIILLHPLYYAKNPQSVIFPQRPGINDNKYGYSELPIAVEAGHDFLPRSYYSTQPNKYFDILDWETALNNTSSVFATGDYKALDALKRNYPQLNIVQSNKFLDKYDRFLVLNEADQKWFETRIKHNTKYTTKFLGTTEGAFGPLEVFLVSKK